MADVQARVQAVLDEVIATDVERGLQVAVYVDGALIVDAWSGVADPATGRRVDGETLFTVFSTTKGITATVIHLLADRGVLEYDAPIARYWPEFGAHGKEQITLRHALTHCSAIPQMPDGVGPVEMCDWEGMCRAIADLTPLWAPGTVSCYHALTYGWILGEVARRVDGRPFGQIVQDEICKPLGITSLFVGLPEAMDAQVAPLEVPADAVSSPIAAESPSTEESPVSRHARSARPAPGAPPVTHGVQPAGRATRVYPGRRWHHECTGPGPPLRGAGLPGGRTTLTGMPRRSLLFAGQRSCPGQRPALVSGTGLLAAGRSPVSDEARTRGLRSWRRRRVARLCRCHVSRRLWPD